MEEWSIFQMDEDVKGTITMLMPAGKKVEHVGIKVEMIGEIGIYVLFAFCTRNFV